MILYDNTMKELKYPVAYDPENNLVHAAKAVKGIEYHCLECGGPMIFKSSRRLLKRPHFSHLPTDKPCSPESAIHLGFKMLLFDKIRKAIDDSAELPFKWQCNQCLDEHMGNLLKKVTRAEMEYNTGDCIPDIALFDQDSEIFAVVEVIVTHAPDDKARDYYTSNNIIVIEFTLKSDLDLNMLWEPVLTPSAVSICLHGKCEKCGGGLSKKYLNIITAECYKCHSPMKAAVLSSQDGTLLHGPARFSIKQMEQARNEGVILKYQYSKTARSKYLANTCTECGAFLGEFFLGSEYYGHADMRHFKIDKIESGFFCHNCGRLID